MENFVALIAIPESLKNLKTDNQAALFIADGHGEWIDSKEEHPAT